MPGQSSSISSRSPEGRCVDEIKLPNGLLIRFLDNSRRVVGDRWYVCLIIEVPIPVKHEYFAGESNPKEAYTKFVHKFGNVYYFRYKKERNFIDEKNVEKLLEQLKDDFLKTNLNYLGNEHFAKMSIKKAMKDLDEKERLERLHQEAIKQADLA